MDKAALPERAENSLVVNARLEQTFPLLEDAHPLMKSVTFLRQVQWATGSGIGARDRCQLEIARRKVWVGAQVHDYEKKVRIGRKNVEGMKMRSEIHLGPECSTTRAECVMSYRPALRPSGSLVEAMTMRRSIREGVAYSQEGLRRLTEAGIAKGESPELDRSGLGPKVALRNTDRVISSDGAAGEGGAFGESIHL